MGQLVLDQQSGKSIFYPDDNTSADTIEQSVSDMNNGAIRQSPKPTFWDNISSSLNKMGPSLFNPILSNTGHVEADALAEGVRPVTQFIADKATQMINLIQPTQGNESTGKPFAPLQFEKQPDLKSPQTGPTPSEQAMDEKISPITYGATQFAAGGALIAAATYASGGAFEATLPFFARIPALRNLMLAGDIIKNTGGVAGTAIKTLQGATIGGTAFGEYSAAESASKQQEIYGNVDFHEMGSDMLKGAGMGFTVGGALSFLDGPLSKLGIPNDMVSQASKRAVISGAVMGAMTAAQGGSKRDILLNTGYGALYGALDQFGEHESVRQAVLQEAINLKTRYGVSQTGGEESAIRQLMTEHTQNDAEQVIHESNQNLMKQNPVPEEQRVSITKPISDPLEARNKLVQFFSPHILARMYDDYVTWLANQPMKELNGWAENQKELDWEKAIQDDYLKKSRSEILDDDARRARGIPVEKTAVDVVANSKELTTNLITKTLNEVTEGEKTTTRGEVIGNTKEPIGVQGQRDENKVVIVKQEGENANKSGTQTGSGSKEEGTKGEARAGVRVRDDGQEGVDEAGEKGISKAAGNINKDFAKRGVESIPEEELSKYDKQKLSDLEDKVLGILSDHERLERVLSGEEKLSDNEAMAVASGAEKMGDANGDNDLLRKVATSPILSRASEIAQALQSRKAFGYEAKDDKVSGVKEVRKTNEDLKKEITPEKGEKIKKTFTQLREKARKLQKEEMLKNISKSLDDVLNKAAC